MLRLLQSTANFKFLEKASCESNKASCKSKMRASQKLRVASKDPIGPQGKIANSADSQEYRSVASSWAAQGRLGNLVVYNGVIESLATACWSTA
jgi:hypothetical protein